MKSIPLIVEFGRMAKAAQVGGRRAIYFEASRDDGDEDREGQSVAVDALWRSKDLFLSQGDLDIAHWGHLPNPLTGLPMPEYRIGLPDDAKLGKTEQGHPTIYCRGEIFSSRSPAPKDSSGVWADRFWHSLTALTPPDRWFPSVYGDIHPGGIEVNEDDKGVVRSRITSVDWFSMGFARRAMHPNLPAVSLSPIGGLTVPDGSGGSGVMAKACNPHLQALALAEVGATRLTLGGLAKAMTAGIPMSKAIATMGTLSTDHANLSGVQALTAESLDGGARREKPDPKYLAARVAILRKLNKGELTLTRPALVKAFEALGFGSKEARKLWREIHGTSQ